MGFNRRKLEDQRREAAEKKAAPPYGPQGRVTMTAPLMRAQCF
jgi:hypothetical protein